MTSSFTRLVVALVFAGVGLPCAAAEPAVVTLPAPDTGGGMPLMQALKARHSSREFSPEPLPPAMLSSLLWAAAGINRPESGKRTAPSAKNWQEVDVYVATAEGAYVYEPKAHALRLVVARDLRALTGRQSFVKDAPVNLVLVADLSRGDMLTSDADKQRWAAAGAGFIAQNVYLYCASAGLATVVRGWIDTDTLGRALQLRPSQQILLAQTVGYPRK